MRSVIITIFLSILIIQSVDAQRLYSNEFMNIGVGANSFAMGNATVAHIDDITSGYWNPAGLAAQKTMLTASLMHMPGFLNVVNHDYFALAYQLEKGKTVGLSLIRTAVDDIPGTNDLYDINGNLDYDRIKKFSVADYGFLFSYAQQSKNENFRYGANVKVIRRTVGDYASAWGFGFDLGTQYQAGKWKLGAVARDVTSTFNAWSFNNEELSITIADSTFNTSEASAIELTLPQVILGIARNFDLGKDYELLCEVNANLTFAGQRHTIISSDFANIDPNVGVQLGYKNTLFARAGVNNIQEVTDFGTEEISFIPNIGLGLHFKKLTIDYALTNAANQAIGDFSHVFSLQFAI
jgi:hypothetical protein